MERKVQGGDVMKTAGMLVLALSISFVSLSAQAQPAKTWRTGQTTSYEAGDDGDLERGVSWPSPRFTDNGNGTVTDNLTGLIWLKNANCFGTRNWSQALSDCNGLSNGSCGLTDGSSPGDWRLPNRKELLSLVDYSRYYPALPDGHLFSNVQSSYYWSATTGAHYTGIAWFVNMYDGDVTHSGKSYSYYVWPVRAGQSDKGQQFINEVKRKLEELTSKTIFGGYSEDQIKHLLFFKFGIPDILPSIAKISISLDLDDLAGITEEGQDGWITYWIDFEFGVGVGTNPLPVGAGFIGVERELNVDDPRRTGSVADLVLDIAGKTFTGITVTEHGVQEGSLLLSSASTDFASFTVLSTTWNLHQGEVSRDVLLNYIGQSFSETGLITSFLPAGRALFNLMFVFDLHKQIVESGSQSIWRSFTSSDAPVETGNRLSIRRVYGGIDVDSDGRQDNYVPHSAADGGKPSVYYPLKLDFFSDDLQEKDFKVVVSNVPAGWVIESIADDGNPPLFNKDTYPVDNATPWTLYRTEWHIGCLRSADKEVTVDFSLYENKLIGDVLIDTVHVKFGFPPTKAMPWIPLLLLDDNSP